MRHRGVLTESEGGLATVFIEKTAWTSYAGDGGAPRAARRAADDATTAPASPLSNQTIRRGKMASPVDDRNIDARRRLPLLRLPLPHQPAHRRMIINYAYRVQIENTTKTLPESETGDENNDDIRKLIRHSFTTTAVNT